MLNKTEKIFDRTLNIILLAVIVLCTVHVVWGWAVGRSLWIDEAMLMKSVLTRDVPGILGGFFDDDQSSPPGYMLIVKVFTSVLGTSEYVLRLPALLAFFAACAMMVFVARDFKFRYPLLALAIFMSLTPVQNFAHECKPYMFDVFSALLAMHVYARYWRGSMRLVVAMAVMAVLVWFSFGAIFVMGGICAWHFFYFLCKLCRKQMGGGKFLREILPLLFPGVSVLLYFFLWVLPASTNVPDPEVNNYWTFLNFPLIPRSGSDISLIKVMFAEFMNTQGASLPVILYVTAGVVFYLVARWRKWLAGSFVLMWAMVLVVSWLGLYPIAQRILLAQYVLVWFLFGYSLDFVVGHLAKNKITVVICMLLLAPLIPVVAANNKFNLDNYYRKDMEFNALYEHIMANRSPDSWIYIAGNSRPMGQYYTGYREYPPLPLSYDSIVEDKPYIWGTAVIKMRNRAPYSYHFNDDPERIRENVEAIAAHSDVWILMTSEVRHHDAFFRAIGEAGLTVQTDTIHRSTVWHVTRR